MGTVPMEEKLAQQLVGLVHKPLFQVLLYVQKPYDYFYRGRCMEILIGDGFCPNLQISLQWYWDKKEVVPKSRNLFEQPFGMERGVT